MAHEKYWKVWLVVLLVLGGLRLLTSSIPSPSSNPTTSSQSTSTSKLNPDLPSSVPAQTSQKSLKKGPSPRGIQAQANSNIAAIENRASTVAVPASKSEQGFHAEVANDEPVRTASVSRPSYFTLNSTKEEVLRIQGTPTRLNDYEWTYGYSTVEFRNDRVVSWTIYTTNPLRARMVPSTTVSNVSYFTIGSTKDEVLAVQGTPTKVGDYEWAYGYSTVEFRNDRVVSWTMYAVNPLRAKKLN